MLRITGGILGIRDDGKDEEEDGGRGGWRKRRTACFAPGGWGGVVVGKRLPPLQSHALSGYVTGLGLSRLCITPSTRLKNLRWTASNDHDRQTNHVPIIISSLFFFSLLFLSSSQSTISLRLLPPYAPRNETSIFVASCGSCSERSLDPGFPPHRHPPPASCLPVPGACNLASLWIEHTGAYMGAYSQVRLGVSCLLRVYLGA